MTATEIISWIIVLGLLVFIVFNFVKKRNSQTKYNKKALHEMRREIRDVHNALMNKIVELKEAIHYLAVSEDKILEKFENE